MVWYNLTIGTFNLKYTPLKPIEQSFPYCDENGNELKRKAKVKGEYVFVDGKGNEHKSAFRLVNGKPMAKLTKTKEVSNYKEVESNEVDDLITEKQYVVECQALYNELRDNNKALKFGFTFGNGFKVYKAYIHTSNLYKNLLFMSVGTTQKSELIKGILQEQKQSKKLQQIDITIQGVDRAKVEDLIQI